MLPIELMFIIAMLIGLIPAYIAKSKGYPFGLWWFYGFMIFIVALPHALLLPVRREKPCPKCARSVPNDAVVCPYCREELPGQLSA